MVNKTVLPFYYYMLYFNLSRKKNTNILSERMRKWDQSDPNKHTEMGSVGQQSKDGSFI